MEGELLLHRQQDLADAEQADDSDQEVEAAHQLVRTEGEPQIARNRVEADAGERKAEHHRGGGLEGRGLAHADEAAEGEEIDGEELPGGPNCKANLAISGDMKVMRMMATKAPKKEPVKAAVSASPARPFLARG